MNEKSFIPAFCWFVTSFILLVIPGDDLPHSSFFDIPFFDKYVHLGMFSMLTFLFCYPFVSLPRSTIFRLFTTIAVLVIAYGAAMEFVQKYFVPGRSFDLIDMLVDAVGSVLGLITIRWLYIKKIGPDGNQGRNQN